MGSSGGYPVYFSWMHNTKRGQYTKYQAILVCLLHLLFKTVMLATVKKRSCTRLTLTLAQYDYCSFFSDTSMFFKVEKYAKVEKSIKPDDSQPTVWPAHVSSLDLWPNFSVSS